ncbi:hypothetical protein SDC9_153228 [bioreactor metagenome]|uniref:Uncharacterized protein n=1 Tax=bioreactor metagenome TaxID=1076179 RepID=A0A645F009_9ZZZZ
MKFIYLLRHFDDLIIGISAIQGSQVDAIQALFVNFNSVVFRKMFRADFFHFFLNLCVVEFTVVFLEEFFVLVHMFKIGS